MADQFVDPQNALIFGSGGLRTQAVPAPVAQDALVQRAIEQQRAQAEAERQAQAQRQAEAEAAARAYGSRPDVRAAQGLPPVQGPEQPGLMQRAITGLRSVFGGSAAPSTTAPGSVLQERQQIIEDSIKQMQPRGGLRNIDGALPAGVSPTGAPPPRYPSVGIRG